MSLPTSQVQQDETHDGAIWRVRWRTVIEHSEKKTPKSSKIDPQKEPYPFFFAANPPPVLRFVVPLRQTERMIAQQTGFSVSPQVLTDHDTIMTRAAAASDRKEPFLKLVVPKELKREFLRKLRRMNITAHALFPGLDGLGRSVGELIQLGADYEEPE